MAYDVVIFDPEQVSSVPPELEAWLLTTLERDPDPAAAPPALTQLIDAITTLPGATAVLDRDHIAVTLAWEQVQTHLDYLTTVAQEQGLAVYDYSGSKTVLAPGRTVTTTGQECTTRGCAKI